ncbi:MAG: DNA repair exonuclease [Alphaproteobacteria bacterium]|nr:DNA repair exonuclease [Alphaproteobacteria bacterium]
MSFRFIHTSDLHLGTRFANIPEPADGSIRGRLREARHGAIGRIAQAARDHGATDILVAGDTFDTPTPSLSVVRQALAAMADDPSIRWWLLPGNHDNLREAEPLWDMIRQDGPGNLHCITTAGAISLSPAATLLPCPVVWRSSGVDPTEALTTMPSDDGSLRIGLAHGGVTDFTDAGANIPPDRDRTARLDYLALGDWHGRVQIGPRVHYSGSPEQDRFKHGQRGVCLAVTLDGPGVPPGVAEVTTGAFLWQGLTVDLTPGADAAAALAAVLPVAARRDVLLRVHATGRAGLPVQVALRRAADRSGPEFAHFDLRTDTLRTQYDLADLDEIDRGGALRLAADSLKAEAEDDTLAQEARDVAADALARLYAIVKEDAV